MLMKKILLLLSLLIATFDPAFAAIDGSYEDITDWQSIGNGRYRDGFVAWAVGGETGISDFDATVEIEESQSNPGLYRVKDPYMQTTYFTDYDEVAEGAYMIVDATDPANVVIPEFFTGVNSYYTYDTDVYGKSTATGTLENKIISFPAFGLAYKLGADGSWVTAQNYDCFRVYLPGAKDYTFTFAKSTSCSDDNTAVGTFTIGADIASIKYSFTASGATATQQDWDPATTDFSAAMTTPGLYTLSATAYDADGNQQGTATGYFVCQEYSDANWTSLGNVSLTEGIVYSIYGSSDYGPNTYDVELQQNNETPGIYRLVNPYKNNTNSDIQSYFLCPESHNHYIVINATDPTAVTMQPSAAGLNMYDYDILRANGTGTLENGKISFPNATFTLFSEAGSYSTYDNDMLSFVIPVEHTVTVATENEAYGTVAITAPEGAADGSITTKESKVTIEATPADGISFMNWTDSEGTVVSTDATYTYEGSSDQTFTAHFGAEVTFAEPTNGIMNVRNGEDYVYTGDVLPLGTELVVNVTANDGYELTSLTFSGEPVELVEGQTAYNVTLSKALEIVATFTKPQFTFNLVIVGNGTVKATTEIDDSNNPSGDEYVNGQSYDMGSGINFSILPGTDGETREKLQKITVQYGEEAPTDVVLSENLWDTAGDNSDFSEELDPEGYWNYYLEPEKKGPMTVTVTFSGETNAIEDIFADEDPNAPIEYFNVQGIRVDADNLTPGFYIVRRGHKTAKILVR